MKEIWKDIKDYEGLYQVSNLGRVKSCERYRKTKNNGKCIVPEKILKLNTGKDGYLRIDLCYNNKHKNCQVHRLVAQTFIPNPENKPQVNHIDCNRQNNNVSNLEWVTPQENTQHAKKLGRLKGNIHADKEQARKNGKKSSKPVIVVNTNTGEELYFESRIEAARQLHLSDGYICKVINKQKTIKEYIFKDPIK